MRELHSDRSVGANRKEHKVIQYEHWKVRDEADGNGTRWEVLGYPEIVSLVPSGFDASKILASGIDLGEAMRKSVLDHKTTISP